MFPEMSGDRSPRKTDKILAGARAVFLARGFEAASMDDVAREAGVARSTLYTHFTSKHDLFAAMMQAQCAHLTDRLRAAEDAEGEIGEVLRRVGRQILDVLLNPDVLGIYRTVLAEVPRFPELGEIFYRSGPRSVCDRVASLLDLARRRGELDGFDCPRAASEHFLGLIQRSILLRHLLRLPTDAADLDPGAGVDRSVDVFLRAYGRRASEGRLAEGGPPG